MFIPLWLEIWACWVCEHLDNTSIMQPRLPVISTQLATHSAWPRSVSMHVMFVYSVETSKCILKIYSPSGSHTVLVFHTKRYGSITTGTPPPLTGALNAGGVGKNCNYQPISGFQVDDWRSVINNFVSRPSGSYSTPFTVQTAMHQ